MRKRFAQLLFVAIACGSLFAGENRWTLNGPDGGAPGKIVFDPVDSTIVYATTGNGVYRSSDGGQHWIVGAGLLGTPFDDVAVASGDPRKVFASSDRGLHKSNDRGVTWSVVNSSPVGKIAVSADGSVVYIASTNGVVLRSSDGGTTFGNRGSGLPPYPWVTGLVIDPQNANTIYLSLYYDTLGVFKSTDGGENWSPANRGLAPTAYDSLLIDPSNSAVLYAGGAPGRIFKTTDAGASWTELTNGLDRDWYGSIAISSPSSTIIAASGGGFYKSTNGGASWTGPSQPVGGSVAIDPFDASNVLIAAYGNLLRSTDGGSTFARSDAGLIAVPADSIAVDPRNDSIVYTAGSAGIFKSVDHGESWTLLLGTSADSVAVDPFNSQTVYATVSGRFQRSLNGGVVWEDYMAGIPSSSLGVAADPLTPGTLYTIGEAGPYKKIGAAPWTVRNSGLPARSFARFIKVDPNNASVLYTGGDFGLYKSTDGGDHWTLAGSGRSETLPSVTPDGLSIDPFDSNHLLTSFRLDRFESTDGGATWTPFAAALTWHLGLLAFDPSTRGRIYNTGSYAVDRSNDGGKSWFSLSAGLGSAQPGHVFAISPNGSFLYNGGSGGGVWVFHESRTRSARH